MFPVFVRLARNSLDQDPETAFLRWEEPSHHRVNANDAVACAMFLAAFNAFSHTQWQDQLKLVTAFICTSKVKLSPHAVLLGQAQSSERRQMKRNVLEVTTVRIKMAQKTGTLLQG